MEVKLKKWCRQCSNAVNTQFLLMMTKNYTSGMETENFGLTSTAQSPFPFYDKMKNSKDRRRGNVQYLPLVNNTDAGQDSTIPRLWT